MRLTQVTWTFLVELEMEYQCSESSVLLNIIEGTFLCNLGSSEVSGKTVSGNNLQSVGSDLPVGSGFVYFQDSFAVWGSYPPDGEEVQEILKRFHSVHFPWFCQRKGMVPIRVIYGTLLFYLATHKMYVET